MDAIPLALRDLAAARDAAAPFEHAFWGAHRALEIVCQEKDALTKDELFAAYDHRLHAGHAWHPFRQAVQQAESWLNSLQKEIAECDTILDQ